MAARKNSAKNWKTQKVVPVRTDIATVEKNAIARTRNTLDSIADFLLRWERTKNKSGLQMAGQVEKIKKFYNALEAWYEDATASASQKDQEERIERLRNFVILCRSYW